MYAGAAAVEHRSSAKDGTRDTVAKIECTLCRIAKAYRRCLLCKVAFDLDSKVSEMSTGTWYWVAAVNREPTHAATVYVGKHNELIRLVA